MTVRQICVLQGYITSHHRMSYGSTWRRRLYIQAPVLQAASTSHHHLFFWPTWRHNNISIRHLHYIIPLSVLHNYMTSKQRLSTRYIVISVLQSYIMTSYKRIYYRSTLRHTKFFSPNLCDVISIKRLSSRSIWRHNNAWLIDLHQNFIALTRVL